MGWRGNHACILHAHGDISATHVLCLAWKGTLLSSTLRNGWALADMADAT